MIALRRRILECLEHHGKMHVVDIATELDDHPITVDRTCYDLRKDGDIRQTGGGVYALTSQGQAQLSSTEE